MDEREVVGLYIAEMRALLPVVQRHLGTLASMDGAEQHPLAAREACRLATAMADLSSGFHVEDCAQLARGIATALSADGETSRPFAVIAAAADILTYIARRVDMMAEPSRILAPTEAERSSSLRLLATLSTARRPVPGMPGMSAPVIAALIMPALSTPQSSVVEHVTSEAAQATQTPQEDQTAAADIEVADEADAQAVAAQVEDSERLTVDELALVRSFQAQTLRPAVPVTGPLNYAGISGVWSTAKAFDAQPSTSAAPPLDGQKPSADDLDYIPPEMKRLFITETTEDLEDLRNHLLHYEEHHDDPGTLLAMGRIGHKIKGAAATLGFDILAALAFTFEDLLKALQTRQAAPGPHAISVLVRSLALLQSALDAASADEPANPAYVGMAHALRDELFADAANGRSAPSDLPPAASAPLSPTSGIAAPAALPAEATGELGLRVARPPEAESLLRVDVRRLDELMNHVGALAVNRAALAQDRHEIERLQTDVDASLARLSTLGLEINDLASVLRSGAVTRTSEAADTASRDGAGGQRFGRRLFGRSDREERPAPEPGSQNGQAWDALELERFTDFDHTLRVLTEVIADLDTSSHLLRATLKHFSHLSEEQAALAGHIQRDVMQIRLVPLSDLVPRLQLEVKRLAPEVGKRITFTVRGEMTEIDRNISEQLAEPLLQLVRNAIVHGIESPAERLEHGKQETGALYLHAYYVGSEVVIEVGDDGAGVNHHRLAAAAVAAEVLTTEEARALHPNDALDLMFIPGLSSKQHAQMVSGRGVGLDQVRTVIQSLKGTIHVHSDVGKGTLFRIRVPISLSIVRSLQVRAGGQQYAVPFSSVQRTVTLSATDILTTAPAADANRGVPEPAARRIRVERPHANAVLGEAAYDEIPLFSLAELLGSEHTPRDVEMGLIIEAGQRRVALLVEHVMGDQEVVVQVLPKHLRRRAVRGATVMPDGQVLLLLDLPELISIVLDGTLAQPQPKRATPPTAPDTLAPRVLIVDDSVSIRRSLELTLERAGFDVQVAHDGIDALERMLVSPPRVVILDIEMPRLDGFELLSIVRSSQQFTGVQVVMLTSRAADKHREHALRLGAQEYLVKPCPQETLVETVRRLLSEPLDTPSGTL